MQYNHDPRYLPGDEDSMESRRLKSEEANVQLTVPDGSSGGDYRNRHALQVVTLENIRVGEELFVSTLKSTPSSSPARDVSKKAE